MLLRMLEMSKQLSNSLHILHISILHQGHGLLSNMGRSPQSASLLLPASCGMDLKCVLVVHCHWSMYMCASSSGGCIFQAEGWSQEADGIGSTFRFAEAPPRLLDIVALLDITVWHPHSKNVFAGLSISAWEIGVASINFTFNGSTIATNVSVSLRGRANDGTWLPILNASTAPDFYVGSSRPRGYRAVWGRAGGWLTGILDGGGDRDGIWALNGADAGLSSRAKVAGYRLQVFDDTNAGVLSDGSFLFDDNF